MSHSLHPHGSASAVLPRKPATNECAHLYQTGGWPPDGPQWPGVNQPPPAELVV